MDKRNKEIFYAHNEGRTFTEIAREYGITRQRAEQIYASFASKTGKTNGDLWRLKLEEPLKRVLIRNGIFTYSEAKRLTVSQMLGWEGVGVVKAKAIYDFFHGGAG